VRHIILAQGQAVAFTNLLFGHTIQAMYANPEYGGNADLVGWRDSVPGDSQPRGYTDADGEQAESGLCDLTGIIDGLLHGRWEEIVTERGGRAA
jgi:hypothetical protein